MKTYTLNRIIPSILVVLGLQVASTASAQYRGQFNSESGLIRNEGGSSQSIGKWLVDIGRKDSAKNPRDAFGHGEITGNSGDSFSLMTASNRNSDIALLPRDQLDRFLNNRSFFTILFNENGFLVRKRTFGAYIETNAISHGERIAFATRASKWNLKNGEANVARVSGINQNYAFFSGKNPRYNNGNPSNVAWKRRGYLGPFTLSEAPLNKNVRLERRFIIGRFDIPSNRKGQSVNRFVSTIVANLTVAERSNVFLIPRNQENRFLNGDGFDFYQKYESGMTSNREIKLPPGRTYSVAIRDGINSDNKGSSEGAEVVFYSAFYR